MFEWAGEEWGACGAPVTPSTWHSKCYTETYYNLNGRVLWTFILSWRPKQFLYQTVNISCKVCRLNIRIYGYLLTFWTLNCSAKNCSFFFTSFLYSAAACIKHWYDHHSLITGFSFSHLHYVGLVSFVQDIIKNLKWVFTKKHNYYVV